jgi:3-(3-hydroxy-phenyl)propionate hydroxylase
VTEELFDVAIVGYGPVGATLANLLGRSGWRVSVLERSTSIHHLPRAAHFDAEIMRVFASLGLAPTILPATAPILGMHFLNGEGKKLFGFDRPRKNDPTDWAENFMFYQPDLERALRAGVERFAGVEVRLAHEVESIRSGDGGVELEARDLESGARRSVRARYVIGCDGARSITRAAVGAELDDLVFDQPWLVVDVMMNREMGLPTVVHQICDPARPTTVIPSAGRHRRWEFMLLPGENAEEMQRPERVETLLSRWIGPNDAEIVRAVVYSFHALLARGWRKGRVILAGDSAHQMPPFLGQGMCSGIRDAANLAWKLDLVLAGRASDALLDSYEIEREPHVRKIVELAVVLGRILQTTDPVVAAARDAQFFSGEEAPVGVGPPDARRPPLGHGILHAASDAERGLAGELLPQLPFGPRHLDDELGRGFAILSATDLRRSLSRSALTFWERAGTRFVDLSAVEGTAGRLGAFLERYGTIVVRPDRYVFGTARDAAGLEALGEELRGELRFDGAETR